MRTVLCSFLFVFSLLSADIPEKEIVVVIPSYNNEAWCSFNLQSVLSQKYQNYRIVYVNDCSTDGTAKSVENLARAYAPDSMRVLTFNDTGCKTIPETVEKFKSEINREKAFFTLVNNISRCRALENIYRVIHSCQGDEIIVLIDGDDWLFDDQVFQRLNEAYSSKEIWITHGSFINYPNLSKGHGKPMPEELIASGIIRRFCELSHLRTFYAWIFKKIELHDLLFKGEFFPTTWDRAILYPILEMAAERQHFFSEPNYVYNTSNPINVCKVDRKLQNQLYVYIRKMRPYPRLEKAD